MGIFEAAIEKRDFRLPSFSCAYAHENSGAFPHHNGTLNFAKSPLFSSRWTSGLRLTLCLYTTFRFEIGCI